MASSTPNTQNEVTMDPEKNMEVEYLDQPIDSSEEAVAHLANQEDHEQTRMQAIKQNPWAFAWCMFAVWLTLLVSFENQASGIVIGIPQFRKDFGYLADGNYVLPAKWQAAFSGGPVASTAIGALTAGFFADLIGRKKTIIAVLCISFGSVSMEVVSTTNAVFFAGKVVNGLAVGVLAAVCPTYVGEVTPLALRGLFTCLIALAYTIGPFTAALILNSTGTVDTRWAYRAVFCSQYGFSGTAALFVLFMPESPWWLCNKGKEEKALRSLTRLGYNKDGEGVKRLAVIKLTLEQVRKETEGASYLECFRKSNLRRTIISIAPLSIQAFCGVIFIAGYSTYYAQLAGFSTKTSFQLFVGLQVTSVTGNIVSWSLIDRIGRRNLTLWGLAFLTVILMLAGGTATAGKVPSIKACLGFMIIYGFFYNMTIGSTAYTILTENATSRLRVKTIAIGVAVQNTWYTMLSLVLPYLFNPDKANLGAKIAFIFGGMAVLCFTYIYFYQPETTGRSYEELDELYMKKVPAREFKTFVTDAEKQGQEASKRAHT